MAGKVETIKDRPLEQLLGGGVNYKTVSSKVKLRSKNSCTASIPEKKRKKKHAMMFQTFTQENSPPQTSFAPTHKFFDGQVLELGWMSKHYTIGYLGYTFKTGFKTRRLGLVSVHSRKVPESTQSRYNAK